MEKVSIRLDRSFLEREFWGKPNAVRLYLYCLLMANPEPRQWQGTTIERGAFVTTIAELAEATNLTMRQTRTAINDMQTIMKVSCRTTKKNTIITINGYENYIEEEEVGRHDERQKNDTMSDTMSDKKTTQKTTQKTAMPTACGDDSYLVDEEVGRHDERQKNDTMSDTMGDKKTTQKTTQKMPEKTTEKTAKKMQSFLEGLKGFGVEEKVAEEWIAIRKAKKASDSETALRMVGSALEAVKSRYGIAASDAISVCVVNGWYGCKPSYFENLRLSDYGITVEGKEENPRLKDNYWQV